MDYTGTQTAFTMRGASGTELRLKNYDTLPSSPGTAYTFDPQGSAVQPLTLYLPGTFPTVKVRSSSAFDGFGLLQAAATADTSDAFDPFGFGGQQGYYRDYSGLYLLTHRYYDAGAGRFINRDPIGYKGGLNLYGFAGNNPVNRSDPSGYQGEPASPAEPGKEDIDDLAGDDLLMQQTIRNLFARRGPQEESRGSTGQALSLTHINRRVIIDLLQALKRHRMSPTSYPNPDPPMSEPPVRYEPKSDAEIQRMRAGRSPLGEEAGENAIEPHHRQQIPTERGGIIDEITRGEHVLKGNHSRHDRPSELTAGQRTKEVRNHWRQRGSEYKLSGE